MSAPRLGQNWQDHLRSLEKGWDREIADPISDAAIKSVESFSVVPCFGGGCQLEFHRDGFNVEIEVAADGPVESVLLIQERVR